MSEKECQKGGVLGNGCVCQFLCPQGCDVYGGVTNDRKRVVTNSVKGDIASDVKELLGTFDRTPIHQSFSGSDI